MNTLNKVEGITPSGVEMIHTPILSENLGADMDAHRSIDVSFERLSTLMDVAKEIVEARKVTISHQSRLEGILSDREDYLEYDIDYLITLIKEYLWYIYTLENWKFLSMDTNTTFMISCHDKIKDLYNLIINKCTNLLKTNSYDERII